MYAILPFADQREQIAKRIIKYPLMNLYGNVNTVEIILAIRELFKVNVIVVIKDILSCFRDGRLYYK